MFYAFQNPIDITPPGTSGWQTVPVPYDETSQNGVPAHANGIVVYAVTNTTGINAGARAVGNTNDKKVMTYYKGYFACAIDSNRQCQLYRDSTNLTAYKLVGYFYGDDFVELSSMVDKTPSTTGAWVTVDVSANVPTGAKAALVMVKNTNESGSYEGSVRPKTSTLGTVGTIYDSGYGYMALVTLNSNRQFEAYIGNTAVKIYLVGYVKQGTWYFNPESRDKRPGTTGSWQTVTLSEMTSGGAAVFLNRVSSNTSYGFRKPTSSDTDTSTLHTYQRQTMSIVGTDANKNVEIYAGSTSIAMLLMGWFESLPYTPQAEAFATSRSSFQISWTPVVKSEGATGYDVQRDTDPGFPNPTTVNVNNRNVTSYEFTGLPKNTRYFARVRVRNEYGNGPWSNVVDTYTFAVQKFTTANPIKDAQGNTLTNVVVVTLRQSILDAIAASDNGEWLDLNKQVRANKIDTYPKEIEVPGGASTDKLVTFWYKSGILGEVQPDLDPTTGA